MEITCPSGLRGVIRGMKMKEQGFLGDEKIIRGGRLISAIISSCWQKTLDSGPYQFGGQAPDLLPWDELLQGDRLFVFKEIRAATYGNEYGFEMQCPEFTCKHKFEWAVLLDQIPFRKLSPESCVKVHTNQPFEITVAGKKVNYRLLLGLDENKILRLTRDSRIPFNTAALMCRVVSVEGLDLLDTATLRDWIEDLDQIGRAHV